MPPSSSILKRPVTIERMLLKSPETTTITTWTTTKPTSVQAIRKWIARALWRPPNSDAQPGQGGIDAGRHLEPREDQHGQHDEENRRVGDLLQDVVLRRVRPVRELELQVGDDVVRDLWQLAQLRHDVAPEMARDDP